MGALVATGFRRLRGRLRLWGLLYLLKLALTLVFTLPILLVTSASLDQSLFASRLMERWSLDVIFELTSTRPDILPTLLSLLFFYSVLVFLIRQWLNGGIYMAFLQEESVSRSEFFAAASAQFPGQIKITLFMLLFYVPLVLLAAAVSSMVPSDLGGRFGQPATYHLFVRLGIVYLFLIPAGILADLLRLRLAATPQAPLRQIIGQTLAFYVRRVVQFAGVYIAFLVPFVVLWIVVEMTSLWITAALFGMLGVILELVLFQVCSWARTGQSLALIAAVGPTVRSHVMQSRQTLSPAPAADAGGPAGD